MDINFPVMLITPLIRTTVVPISGIIGTTVVRIASVKIIGYNNAKMGIAKQLKEGSFRERKIITKGTFYYYRH